MAVSSSGTLVAVTNNGQSTQTLQLIDRVKEQVLDSVIIPKSWLGLKFSGMRNSYMLGGNDNCILNIRSETGSWSCRTA